MRGHPHKELCRFWTNPAREPGFDEIVLWRGGFRSRRLGDCNLISGGTLHSWSESSAVEPGDGQLGNVGSNRE